MCVVHAFVCVLTKGCEWAPCVSVVGAIRTSASVHPTTSTPWPRTNCRQHARVLHPQLLGPQQPMWLLLLFLLLLLLLLLLQR